MTSIRWPLTRPNQSNKNTGEEAKSWIEKAIRLKNDPAVGSHLVWNEKINKWHRSTCGHGLEYGKCEDPECVAEFIHDE
jgi:hypothetical protein